MRDRPATAPSEPRTERPGRGILLNLVASVLAIGIAFGVCYVRDLPVRETLGLRWTSAQAAALWALAFGVLVVLHEVALRALGLTRDTAWTQTPGTLLLRAFAVVIAAPAAEELVFRGLLFSRLLESPLGSAGAVILPSVGFALLHVQYRLPERLLIFVDGLFFGFVRLATGSTLLALVLHSAGNLYAVAERCYRGRQERRRSWTRRPTSPRVPGSSPVSNLQDRAPGSDRAL